MPIQAVIGVLKLAERILVAKRPEGKPYSGYWEFPGGKIEINETPYTALKREFQEELGIEVVSAKPWFEILHTYPEKTVHLHIWLIDAYTGEPVGKENQLLDWVTLPQMQTLKVLEGNFTIIDRLNTLFLNKGNSEAI